MKIIYYSDAKIPSLEANSIHIMKMAQAFSNNGNKTELIAPDVSEVLDDDPYAYYGVKKCFTLTKLPLKKVKGKIYLYAFQAAKYIEQSNPNLAYGRSINIAFFLSIATNVPFGLELHQPIGSALQQFFFKRIIKSSNLKKIVVISKALEDYFIQTYHLSKDLFLVAHDGADILDDSAVNMDISLLGRKEQYQLSYIGQLYKGKGMEIIEQLVPALPSCNFHIVGGKKQDVEFWQKKLINYPNVFFYGHVPHSQTVAYGMKSDAVLAPYMSKVYGAGSKEIEVNDLSRWMSPLKIFEYMSMGKPIISTDLPVIREILKDKETAILCSYNNIQQWIEAIHFCQSHKSDVIEMGKRAKQEFASTYTWDIRAKKIAMSMDW